MEFIEEGAAGAARIKIMGEATIYQAVDMKNRLLAALLNAETLELDLNGVTEADTSCAQILLLLSKESARRGKLFRLSGLSEPAQQALRLLGLDGYLKQYPIS